MRAPIFAISTVLLVLAAAAAGWWLGSRDATAGVSALSDLRLPTLDGSQTGPVDAQGQVVLIDFWATWCAPCRAQAKIIEMLVSEYAGKEVVFFAVNVGETESTVRDYLRSQPFSYPVLLDESGSESSAAGVYGLPTVAVLGRDGTVILQRSGITGRSALSEAIREALSSPVAATNL